MKTATKALLATSLAALIAVPILAQQRGGNRLPAECRQEIVALCGRDRAQMRTCLREKYTELSATCSAELRERVQQRNRDGGGAAQSASAAADRTISYGADQRQQVDLYLPDVTAGDSPLILFIHGGGWSFGNHKTTVQAKPDHFTKGGYAFASSGYRLLPEAPVEQQAEDIGAAIRALRAEAEANGFDPDHIVLMGHSAGAHLAALVATDPRYAGEAFGAIEGVILLDGAGYDIAASMKNNNPMAQRIYDNAFGSDPARHKALSPITHAGAPDAPHWLALYVAERDVSKAQSEALAAALARAGAQAQAVAITGTDHGRMSRELGTAAGAAQTQTVDAFLQRVFG